MLFVTIFANCFFTFFPADEAVLMIEGERLPLGFCDTNDFNATMARQFAEETHHKGIARSLQSDAIFNKATLLN